MNNNSNMHHLAITLAIAISALVPNVALADDVGHEVWLLDQSNTYDSDGDTVLDSGGRLYIYNGDSLSGKSAADARPEVIELGGAFADAIKQQTGAAPVRPHYIAFNASLSHAIISFVTSGHVVIMNAATRESVFTVDVGTQAHAAVPSPDESYILVANQNGKLLQRINTDYAAGSFTLNAGVELNLAMGTTPSGALKQDDGVTQIEVRPDNAPILALPDASSNLAFVTLRGGGLFVIKSRTSPMEIVAEYTKATIEPAGLLAIQHGDKLYFNSGGGGGSTLGFQSVLYSLPVGGFSTTPNLTPDSPAPTVVFDHEAREVKDSHGLVLTKQGRYLWVADRAANLMVVVDTATDTVTNEISLVAPVSSDPAPDILGISPAGNRVYASLRGPNPLTGNNSEVNNAKGETPGVGIVRVQSGGRNGTLHAVARISNLDSGGVERADPHGLAVRSLAD